MAKAYTETLTPYIHIKIYDGRNKVYDSLIRPDEIKDVLKRFNAEMEV